MGRIQVSRKERDTGRERGEFIWFVSSFFYVLYLKIIL